MILPGLCGARKLKVRLKPQKNPTLRCGVFELEVFV